MATINKLFRMRFRIHMIQKTDFTRPELDISIKMQIPIQGMA